MIRLDKQTTEELAIYGRLYYVSCPCGWDDVFSGRHIPDRCPECDNAIEDADQ